MNRSLAMLGACALILTVACNDDGTAAGSPENCKIHGIVVDISGKPIPGAEIHLLWPKSRYASIHSSPEVDLKGEFRLDVPSDQALRLWASAPGHQQVEAPVLISDEVSTGSLRVVLPEIDDGDEPQLEWSTELTYLAEMAMIRRLARPSRPSPCELCTKSPDLSSYRIWEMLIQF